jgi:hypothetical protein
MQNPNSTRAEHESAQSFVIVLLMTVVPLGALALAAFRPGSLGGKELAAVLIVSAIVDGSVYLAPKVGRLKAWGWGAGVVIHGGNDDHPGDAGGPDGPRLPPRPPLPPNRPMPPPSDRERALRRAAAIRTGSRTVRWTRGRRQRCVHA